MVSTRKLFMKRLPKFLSKFGIIKILIAVVILVAAIILGIYIFMVQTEKYDAVWKLRHSYNNLSKAVREASTNDGDS